MPLSPDIAKRLEALETDALRVKLLQEQADAMTDEAATARRTLQERYRAQHQARFSSFDYKMALTGAAVSHRLTIGPASYLLSPPSADTSRKVDALAKDHPMTQGEAFAVAWVISIQAAGMPARDLKALKPEERLAALRNLPDIVINRIAEECNTLQAWLNTVMELELGN
jgi:hypothetical protein